MVAMVEEQPRDARPVLMWILGCGAALLVGTALLCGGAAFFGYRFFDQKLPELAAERMSEAIEATPLPGEDKRALVAEVRRVSQAYKDDRIGFEELGTLIEKIAKGGAIHVGLIHALRTKVRDEIELTPEEKLAAETTLNRAERGIWEGSIPPSKLEEPLSFYLERRERGFEFSQRGRNWDDPDELRGILEALEREADAAEVPEDAPPVDLGRGVARMVDDALGIR